MTEFRCSFTKECLELDVSGDEVVEFDSTVLITVTHHDCIERCVAHSITCKFTYAETLKRSCS